MLPLSFSMRLRRRLKRVIRQPISWAVVGWVAFLVMTINHFLLQADSMMTYVSLVIGTGCVGMLGWAVGSAGNAGAFGDLLRQAIDVLPEARLITARDGSTVYANPGFKRLMPVMPGKPEITGMVDLLEGEDAQAEFKRLRGNARNGVGDYCEVPIRLRDGTREWRRISVAPLGKPAGFTLWLVRDVSARREMETAQRKEFRQMFDFLDNLPVGFSVLISRGAFVL